MGFTNTNYTDVINSLVKSNINILQNPLYLFNDKKATITDYYNKDVNKSTLDESAGIEYDTIGKNCPSKFNMIEDALLFGIEKIQLHYSVGDSGVFSDDITGEAYVLPNTFIPQVGDFFEIKYIQERVLFIVNEVQTDTLDNGSNFYKISYKLDQTGIERIEELQKYNVIERFKMLTSTIGTSMDSVIKSTDYDFIAEIEGTTTALKEYYKQLFFKNPIQTFSFVLNDFHLYDPFLIEFMIRNKILSGTKDYTYVDHSMHTWETFGIDYDHTFFRALEECSKKKADRCNTLGVGVKVDDPLSLMTTRMNDYYYIDYNLSKYPPFMSKIEVISNALIDTIMGVENTSKEPQPKFYKLVVDYFNGTKITPEDLSLIDRIEYENNKELFYFIPILIFILEKQVKVVLDSIRDE